jgi:hypothetical protein
MLGAAWKDMKDSDKKPYQDMAERDKTRAETEKAAYVSALETLVRDVALAHHPDFIAAQGRRR